MLGFDRHLPSLATKSSRSGDTTVGAFGADDNAPLGQDQLDVAQAQAEQVVKPDGVLDDLGWKRCPEWPVGPAGISPA